MSELNLFDLETSKPKVRVKRADVGLHSGMSSHANIVTENDVVAANNVATENEAGLLDIQSQDVMAWIKYK